MTLLETLNAIATSTINNARLKTHKRVWEVLPHLVNVRADQKEKALKAECVGADGSTYEVTLTLESGKVSKYECTCEASEKDPHAPCKHALAVAWRWEYRQTDDKGQALAQSQGRPSHHIVRGTVERETAKAVLIKDANGKKEFFPKRFVEGNEVDGFAVPYWLMEGKDIASEPTYIVPVRKAS